MVAIKSLVIARADKKDQQVPAGAKYVRVRYWKPGVCQRPLVEEAVTHPNKSRAYSKAAKQSQVEQDSTAKYSKLLRPKQTSRNLARELIPRRIRPIVHPPK
jgi:hypothetical protein